MILLLGGTSETGPLALALRAQGWPVLVSTATDAPLDLPPGVRRRCGRLDAQGLADLCRHEGIRALVDAGHPFAIELHATCRAAARLTGLPLLQAGRSEGALPPSAHLAESHEAAARIAFALGGPVFLTTGSRHLAPYVEASRRTNQAVTARVLDHPESLAACGAAGLPAGSCILGRGPFSLEDNLEHLRQTGARVLVTKASGQAGGVDVKLEAAHRLGIPVVVVQRPEDPEGTPLDVHDLIRQLRAICPPPSQES